MVSRRMPVIRRILCTLLVCALLTGLLPAAFAAGPHPGARFLRIADRAEAIRTAVMLSRPGDIILVAGKGHETYQIVGDVKHPFDDREEIKKRFALLN